MTCVEFSRFWISAPGWMRRLGSILLPVTALVAATACRSPGGGHASVVISGQSINNIRVTTAAVFNEAGYALTTSTANEMMFQKLGGRGQEILYGSWESSGVMDRVRVRFEPGAKDEYQLIATVYAVRDAGDSVFEEENRKLLISAGSYRKLLNEVKQRLAKAPPTTPTPKP